MHQRAGLVEEVAVEADANLTGVMAMPRLMTGLLAFHVEMATPGAGNQMFCLQFR